MRGGLNVFSGGGFSKPPRPRNYTPWRRRRWRCTRPRRKSTSLVPNTTPPPTACRRGSSTRSPLPRSAAGCCSLARPSVLNVIPPPICTRCRRPPRAGRPSRCIAMPTSGCRATRAIHFTPTPTRRPTRQAGIRSGQTLSTTASGPIRIRRPMARCSWTARPGTCRSSTACSKPPPCAMWTSGPIRALCGPTCTTGCSKAWRRWCIFTTSGAWQPMPPGGRWRLTGRWVRPPVTPRSFPRRRIWRTPATSKTSPP